MRTIIFNSTNVVAGDNSKFTYKFPVGAVNFKDEQVAVSSVSLYYSWFNITANNSNNTYSYYFPTGSSRTLFGPYTITDGFYTISQLNSYIQNQMISNGHYLVDANGNNVYYLELTTNSTYYAIQINAYSVPTSLPSGYTRPSNWAGYPTTANTPQFVVSSNNITSVFGLSAGTYPSSLTTTNFSQLSTFTPQVSPTQSIIVACSLVRNPLSNPNNLIYAFAPTGTTFGSLISVQPSGHLSFIDVYDGPYTEITLQFLDQNFSPLKILDTNLVVMLTMRNKSELK
jgi:hypothetical protein